MAQEAEKYKAEDERQRDRAAAKNDLESYCFVMKQAIEDEKLKDKISEGDRKKVQDKCTETLAWLDANQTAKKEDFEHHQEELQRVCNPIVTELYAAAGGAHGGMPGGAPRGPSAGGAGVSRKRKLD